MLRCGENNNFKMSRSHNFERKEKEIEASNRRKQQNQNAVKTLKSFFIKNKYERNDNLFFCTL